MKPYTEEQLMKAFKEFDDHPNGILSLAEIDKALLIVAPDLGKDKPAIMRAYKAADVSQDGFISKKEVHSILLSLSFN